VYVAIAELPAWMSAKEVGPFLVDDLLRGVMNKNDDVWLVHWRLAGIPDLHNVAMLDLIRAHTANRIPVPRHRLTADPMLPLAACRLAKRPGLDLASHGSQALLLSEEGD
jgi:hypothetical protein